MAYLSNLSVAPSHRRRGVATAMLAHAEATAAGWGCRAAALHCNSDDAGLVAMYRARGYRHVATEPPWAPPLALRRTRLALMCKRLPRGGGARAAAQMLSGGADDAAQQQQ